MTIFVKTICFKCGYMHFVMHKKESIYRMLIGMKNNPEHNQLLKCPYCKKSAQSVSFDEIIYKEGDQYGNKKS